MRVSVVVLSWNGRADTLACLRSLERVEYTPFDVIVVDNGSVDGSADAIAAQHPGVTLVRNEHNLGFAGGMNVGIRAALQQGADGVLTLNNDMVAEPGFLGPLAAALGSDSRAGAACSQILFANEPPRVWYAGARYQPRRGYQGRHTLYGRAPLPSSRPPYETDRACGGAMLVPRRVLEAVGLFDDALFAYAEDVEWSLRARALGYRVLVVPASVVRHRVSASSGGESSPVTIYYGLRNSLVVAERHAPLGRVGTARRRAVAVSAHLVQALVSRRRAEGIRAMADALRDLRAARLGPRRG